MTALIYADQNVAVLLVSIALIAIISLNVAVTRAVRSMEKREAVAARKVEVIHTGHPMMALPHQGIASGNISMWTRLGSRCGVPAVDVITRENIF